MSDETEKLEAAQQAWETEAWRMMPHTFAVKASNGEWTPHPHLFYLGDKTFEAIRKGNGRLIVNMPPAHGKTQFLAKWLPAWYLNLYSQNRVILTSYAHELAVSSGRWVRDFFQQNKGICTTRLNKDSKNASRFNTTEGGGMYCAGIGGAVTGFHANLLLVDDPTKDMAEANSWAHRKKVVDWFTAVLYKRRLKNASIIVLMTRWHTNDLAGWILKNHPDKWTHIKLPAFAKPGDPLGRKVGQILCPDLQDITSMESDRRADLMAFEAMCQQDPQAGGAGKAWRNFNADRVPVGNVDPHLVLNPNEPLQVTFDFNVNPGMHAIVGQHLAGDRFTAVHEIHGPRMLVEPCVIGLQRLIESLGGFIWPQLQLFGDATSLKIRDPSASQSGFQMIRRMMKTYFDKQGLDVRIRLRTPKGNPPIKDSMDSYNDVLCDPDGLRLYSAHPRCTRLMIDLADQMTDEFGLLDKTDTSLSHASDAERYRIHYLRPIRSKDARPKGRYGIIRQTQ